ncbi:MAG TPA: alpha/beta hydrolase [bacterium]|nr:alpha/beta hydrolase [bacterium]
MKFARLIFVAAVLLSSCFFAGAQGQSLAWPAKTLYRSQEVEGRKIFYREAGDPQNPTILLLHGFPSSSHTYRELIPLLSGKYHVIAPDYLGSGYSEHPDPDRITYTFDLLALHVDGLLSKLGIESYVVYMQDFGAPVGYRLMMKRPKKVRGLIVQNANAYMDGLTEARQNFFKKANQDRSPESVAALHTFVGRESVIHKQYLRDVAGREEIMSPDAWTFDLAFLDSEKDRKIQVQLFQDYYNNLLAYPRWQEFLRKQQPPALIVWGKNDPAFIAAGAEAYRRDLPKAQIHLLDAGHFAVEEKAVEIAQLILRFMQSLESSPL